MRIVLALAVLAVASPLQAFTAQDADTLSVDRMVICSGIEGREPVGGNSQFFESAERLFCYTEISGARDTTAVEHVWYYGEREMARVRLPVRSAQWRTWSSKKLLDSWSGVWRVDALSSDGRVLASTEFVYKPLGDQDQN